MTLPARSRAIAAVLLVCVLALSGVSAAQADDAPAFSLSATSVAAGGTVVVSGDGWGDLSGAADPTTAIYLVSAAEGEITSALFPASAGPWTHTLTIPGERRSYEYDVWPTTWEVCVGYRPSPGTSISSGCSPLEVTAPPASAIPLTAVYRFWSPRFNNAHFFTTNADEAAHIRATDTNWSDEGVAFHAVPVGENDSCVVGPPVFRFYSAVFQSHFYTQDWEEKQQIVATDRNWTYEGVAYCAPTSPADGAVPLYRFWSPAFGKHFFTASQSEADHLRAVDRNWNYEGIAYYVFP